MSNLPTLDNIPAEDIPTHLLLIADTKMGKSTYAAQCAIDGFTLIYIDSDNGISALKHTLKEHPDAWARVIHLRTDRPCELQEELLTKGIFRWNRTKDKMFSSGSAAPDDEMLEIVPALIPKGVLIVNDSWTSTSLDAMEIGAGNSKTTLEEMSKANKGQEVYGDAGMRLNLLCAVYQHCAFNIINIAHPTMYERYEKPKGSQVGVKQKDMVLLETIKIPLSCSRPHGYSMGKYFTDIGWIELDTANRRQLDFTLEYKRVGGGRPNMKGSIESMSFRTLFGDPIPVTFDESWIRAYTTEEWKAVNQSSAAKPAGVKADGSITSTPAKQVSQLMLKKA